MKIDAALVQRVAGLAHLELSADEVVYYQSRLAKILDHIDQLNSMPDPLPAGWRSDTAAGPTAERPDIVVPSLSPDLALAQAPERADSTFQVPRIIE